MPWAVHRTQGPNARSLRERGQLGDFILEPRMSIAVPQVLDLLDDQQPTSLLAQRLIHCRVFAQLARAEREVTLRERGQLGDFILEPRMSIAVPQVLDLLDDMRPIDPFDTASPAASRRSKAACLSDHRWMSSP
jgi:hypothetical protein